eukprot:CAMPEP_0115469630 /NCGR_PEP_ID=MMETSP0271-20121206/51580_1 /TAXON_ID=71861 /ORGANISM="Scrippsiella trochoidea, Strain CCMP3099" /LENGTH=489 /DNA_ID=CAMNT_0002896737 /DNA_START=53 /DNA_END=1519 /DNA_ORIENTATION=+
MIQVALSQPVKLELVDEEIIAVAGCDLGFIMPGKPPQVLQVEKGSEMAAHSIRTDDVLVSVDGRSTQSMPKDELEQLLRTASRLTFERPGGIDFDMKPPTSEPGRNAASVALAAAEAATTSAQATPPLAPPAAATPAAPAADAAATASAAEAEAPAAAPSPGVAVDVSSPAASMEAGAKQPPAAAEIATPVQVQAAPAKQADNNSSSVRLRTGMKVRLIGFQSREMNNQRGRLGKYSEKQGCWQVFLDSTSASKAVRPPNLEPIIEDGDVDMSPAANGTGTNEATPSAVAAAGDAVAALAANPLVAAMAAAMRGVVPAPALPQWDGPGPPPGPEWFEDVLPPEEDKESWVELLRDAYVSQLQADAEHPEPPPFHRANHFAASVPPNMGRTLPEGKYPNQALNFQLQMLFRARTGEYNAAPAAGPYGGGGGYGQNNFWTPGGRRYGGGGKGYGGGYGPAPRRPLWVPQLPGGAAHLQSGAAGGGSGAQAP